MNIFRKAWNWRAGLHFRITDTRLFSRLLLPLLAWLAFSPAAVADNKCSFTANYHIVTPQLLAIQCLEDVSEYTFTSASVQFDSLTLAAGTPVSAGERHYFLVPTLAPLQPNKSYTLSIAGITFVDPATQKTQPTLSFSTNETVSVNPSMLNRRNQYEVTSNLGFLASPNSSDYSQPCKLTYQDAVRRKGQQSIAGDCSYFAPTTRDFVAQVAEDIKNTGMVSLGRIQAIAKNRGFSSVGEMTVTVTTPGGQFSATQMPLGIDGLVDIFGNPLNPDPKSKFRSLQAPATKDAAFWYLSASWAGGVGTLPAWVVDAKAAPPIGGLVKGYQFAPLVTADIGHNTISGVTYTDTIDIGGTATKVFSDPWPALEEIVFTPGVTYETDREFDRDNILATIDFQFYFHKLYSLQIRQSLINFIRDRTCMQNGKAVPGCTPNPNLQASQEPTPKFGYGFDFHLGAEAGGSVIDTTIKASKGTAKLTLPQYTIFRLVPVVHGTLQFGTHLTFDGTVTARYLTTSENSVFQLADNSLELEHPTGWKPYTVLTTNWKLDQTSHFALTITYKDGFAPPKFQRVDTVMVGLSLIY